MSDDMIFFTKF